MKTEKKKLQKEWNKKNLKNIKELEEKNKKIREEKKNFVSPEPYKIEKFKNIPSKLKTDTSNRIIQEQNRNMILPKTANVGQKRNFSKPRPNIKNNDFILNSAINKPSTSNLEVRPFINEANTGEENIYNILNNKTIYYSNN